MAYRWSDNSTDSFFVVKQSGKYWVRIERDGCVASDTINISEGSTAFLDLGEDTTICGGGTFELDAQVLGGISYRTRAKTNQKLLLKRLVYIRLKSMLAAKL